MAFGPLTNHVVKQWFVSGIDIKLITFGVLLCHVGDHCSSRGMATGSHFPRSPLGAGARHSGGRGPHDTDVLLEDGARSKTSYSHIYLYSTFHNHTSN